MRDPLVSSEVDLRDFGYMPLDVVRLRDSDLAAHPEAEVFRACVLSWCVAWHQSPAASLPDDDHKLARLLGYGRDVKLWTKLRSAGALRGFIKCSDGRLYHPVVAEKANEAWRHKVEQRNRTEAARIAREQKRLSQSLSHTPSQSSPQTPSQPMSHSLSQTNGGSVTDDVTESKGREGKGREDIKEKSKALSGSASPAPDVAHRGNGKNGHHAKAIEVLGYLNSITESHFRPVKSTLSPIEARLTEGYTPERLKEIALLKAEQWGKDEKMRDFLRPKTLYSATNCANYDGILPNGVDNAAT